VFPDFVFKTAGMIYAVQPVGDWTPLMYAARDGAIDAVRALADGGADMNLVDPDGTTALTLAILNGHFDTAVALLQKGANPNIPDKSGMTALYAAVDMHTIQTVWGRLDRLLSGRAGCQARYARSPRSHAARRGSRRGRWRQGRSASSGTQEHCGTTAPADGGSRTSGTSTGGRQRRLAAAVERAGFESKPRESLIG
jgi:hypothetical protein